MNLYLAGFKTLSSLVKHEYITWDDVDGVLLTPYDVARGKMKRNEFEKTLQVLVDKKKNVFLDSGAHSIHTLIASKFPGRSVVEFKEFWEYVDGYIEFIKRYEFGLTVYVTVDVIYNAEKTWEVLLYMEDRGVRPLPVFHHNEDMSWFRKYICKYDYIGIGALGQENTVTKFIPYANSIFKEILDGQGKVTKKIHGFAMTSESMMKQYPWHSVDSTSWCMMSAHGYVLTDFGSFHISDRDAVNGRNVSWKSLSGVLVEKIDNYLNDRYGISIEEVSRSGYLRAMINIDYYVRLGRRCQYIKPEVLTPVF